jgi:PAS domain S-box-containing protein
VTNGHEEGPTGAPFSNEAGSSAEERFLALLLDAVRQAVIATDMSGHIVYWNLFAEQLYGWKASEVKGKIVVDVLLPEERRHLGYEALARWPGSGPKKESEWLLTRRDGSRVLVKSTPTPILDEKGTMVGVAAISWDIAEEKRLEEERRQRREQLETLSRRLLEAQESERRRLAHELHDDFGQLLTAIRLNVRAAPKNPARLDEAMNLVDQAIAQVRSLALELRPSILDDLGLVAALRWLLDRQAERAGYAGDVRASVPQGRLPAAIETSCFRLAQEALTNVVRHAEARHVSVQVEAGEEEIEIVVRDDGKGFDVPRARENAVHGASLGLLSMEERVALAGGRLEVQSAPGKGTTVKATFPLPGEGSRPGDAPGSS